MGTVVCSEYWDSGSDIQTPFLSAVCGTPGMLSRTINI